MKMMLIAGVLITLPAIAIVIIFFGTSIMVPALASLAVNSLPFLVGAFLIGRGKNRGEGGLDAGH